MKGLDIITENLSKVELAHAKVCSNKAYKHTRDGKNKIQS